MLEIEISKEEVEDMIRAVDADGSGTIDLEEFTGIMAVMFVMNKQEQVRPVSLLHFLPGCCLLAASSVPLPLSLQDSPCSFCGGRQQTNRVPARRARTRTTRRSTSARATRSWRSSCSRPGCTTPATSSPRR